MPQTTKKRSWLTKLRAWFKARKNQKEREKSAKAIGDRVVSVVYLPQEATCMNGHLSLAIPQDFKVLENRATAMETVLYGSRCDLMLTISAIPFQGALQQITPAVLQQNFIRALYAVQIDRFEQDYIRFSPRVCMYYSIQDPERSEYSVCALVQQRKTVYSLLFTENVKPNLPVIDTMISTIQLH
ncbi:MAG: hypothetical protein MJ062_07575 [Oscillospiraceae bacterium]|nr:hypothetical protein [Oscillospiraceae bacterium]